MLCSNFRTPSSVTSNRHVDLRGLGGCAQGLIGWVNITRTFCVCGKSSQNIPKPVLIFWSSIPRVFCLYIHG